MANTVYTMNNCPVCELVKHTMREMGLSYDEVDLENIQSGQEMDIEVMAQLSMQNMAAPVLMINDKFVEPEIFLLAHTE